MRDRHETLGPFSASRDGKRLNMLGFNGTAAREPASLVQQPLTTANERDRDISGIMGAYGSSQAVVGAGLAQPDRIYGTNNNVTREANAS